MYLLSFLQKVLQQKKKLEKNLGIVFVLVLGFFCCCVFFGMDFTSACGVGLSFFVFRFCLCNFFNKIIKSWRWEGGRRLSSPLS